MLCYVKVTRYRQGVVVEFQVKGQLYLADPMYLLLEVVATIVRLPPSYNLTPAPSLQVVATIVLLGACATVTSWVAFYMIPHGISATLYTIAQRSIA